jgi:cation transport ATPase
MKKYSYGIQGFTWASCVSHVQRAAERALCRVDDKEGDVSVSLLTLTLTVTVSDGVDKQRLDRALKKEIEGAGYRIETDEERLTPRDKKEKERESAKKAWISFGACAALSLILMLFRWLRPFRLVAMWMRVQSERF